MSSDFDIIIVGSGLVSLVLASFLAEKEFKVAIVEAEEVRPISLALGSYQLRVSAINDASEKIFKRLDVWDKILSQQRLSTYENMLVWDSRGRGLIEFNCTEIAENKLGYIIENSVIHNALLKKINKFHNLVIFDQTQPIELSRHQNSIGLRLSRHSALTAKLIVGADGANSWVRQKARIKCFEWPYHHEALVATVETECSHQKTAWQCFLSEGPLALLPLFDQHVCSIVWSASSKEIKRLAGLDDEGFNFEITHAFEHRLGKIKKISNHITFPLVMRHAKNYIEDRIALVGDAAHTIHPLAGQGINLGFKDACSLAEEIIDAQEKTGDSGHYSWLRKYERNRKSDNWFMIFGVELFKQIFANESAAAIYLRSLGLNWVNKSHLIKNQFIYKAIGKV